jgi:hypothetical protein
MVNKKKKNADNNNTKSKKDYIDVESGLDMVIDRYTGEINPYPEKVIRAIAAGAPLYFENNPRAMKLKEYQRLKRICSATWSRWVNKYDWFRHAHELTMEIIGDKRELACMFRDVDSKTIFHTQYQYDPDWAAADKYHSDLKKDAGENKTQVVVIEKFSEEDK